jgi:hypothetical protein
MDKGCLDITAAPQAGVLQGRDGLSASADIAASATG